MHSGKMCQLKEVDRIAVVYLIKSGVRIFFAELDCSAVGTTSKTAKCVCFQGVEFKA